MLPLFNHQKEGVNFIVKKGGVGALFWEMGTGKTRATIETLKRIRETDPKVKMLVIAPISLLEAAWGDDIKRFSNFNYWNLRKTEAEREDEDTDIFGINYEALLSKKNIDQIKFVISGYGAQGYSFMAVLDESSKIKNHQTQITKLLLKMTNLFKYRIVMTGTPAANSEMEYWPQMQFAVPGSLGTSMTVFKNYFFHLRKGSDSQSIPVFMPKQIAHQMFKSGWKYEITPAKREELMRLILPHVHLAKKKDCLDLPDQIDEIREVEMAPDQARAYREMEKQLVTEIQNQQIAAPLAITKLMKLRQISSGFVYSDNGEALEISNDGGNYPERISETPKIIVKQEFSNPKLRELFDIIEEAGDQPIMIWINFHWEQIKICHELHSRFPDQVVTLSSLTKDKDESIRAFQEGRARFLVAHPASAAHGLTFVNCALQIFFSLDFSWEKYEQARARIHRAGQKNNCTYVHILAKNTIDRHILDVLRKKGDAQDLVYRIVSEYRKETKC